MKHIITSIFAVIFFAIAANAQGINFAITLSDANGAPQPNAQAVIRLSIIPEADNGQPTYIETHNAQANSYGVAHLVIGEGSPVAGDFDQIDWSVTSMYLKVERAENAAAEYQFVSTMRLGATPYAYHANAAERLILTSPDGSKWEVKADENGQVYSSPISKAQSPEYGTVDYIFDMEALPTITLEISTDEWNQLLTNFDLNSQNEECIHADFYFNKYGRIHHLSDIGLRLRGNTSRIRPEGSHGTAHSPNGNFNHVHFGFRFQKFHKDDPDWLLSGTDRFNLRWANNDPTYCHEIYGFDLMRRFGVKTTARSSYCRVFIKIKEDPQPINYGVYEMFEAYDDQYLDDMVAAGNFAGTKGYMWKGSWGSGVGADFTNASTHLMGIEDVTLDPSTSQEFTYDYKSKKKQLEQAKTQLVEFINNLNNLEGEEFHQWAETAINVDLLLKAMACEVAIGHWDNCWNNGNNFYIYFDNDGDGRMHYMPYDLDNTLGTAASNFNPATHDLIRWGHSPLFNKILAVNEYRAKYVEYLKQLADPDNDFIDPVKSAARITKWHDMIRDYVDNDTHQDTKISDIPAPWSYFQDFRILDVDSPNNFFRQKINAINALK